MMILSKADLGPKRRIFDKIVRYGVVAAIGWSAASIFYSVHAIPGLKDSAYSWAMATSDRFETICNTVDRRASQR